MSYGGLLSLEFALRYPQRVKAAIIVSATGEGFTPTAILTVKFPNRLTVLPQIKTPSLVVQSRQDTIFPPAMGEALAKGLANGEFVVLDGGHGINRDAPREFNRAVLEFLARVEA